MFNLLSHPLLATWSNIKSPHQSFLPIKFTLYLRNNWWNLHLYYATHWILFDDYYCFKIGGYKIIIYAIVDCNKNFNDVYVGLYLDLSMIFKCWGNHLYKQVQYKDLLEINKGACNGILPYFLGDKGYLLISFMMITFKEKGQCNILELLYNQKHKCKHFVVKNVFEYFQRNYLGSWNSMWFSYLMYWFVLTSCTTCWYQKDKITFNN